MGHHPGGDLVTDPTIGLELVESRTLRSSKLTHIYVMEYDNGTCKVGVTGNPDSRAARLRQAGSSFGVRALRFWISPELTDAVTAEKQLIATLGDPLFGRETFKVQFDHAVAVAKSVGTPAMPGNATQAAFAELERLVALPDGTERALELEAATRERGELGRLVRKYLITLAELVAAGAS